MKVQTIDLHADIMAAVLWQYDSSPAMRKLAEFKQSAHDRIVTNFWYDWYRDVFNIDTANGFGLAVWARILDIPLEIVAEKTSPSVDSFGFDPVGENFGNGNFGRWRDGSVSLSLEQQRIVIRLRYFNLTHKPTLDNINGFLKAYLWEDSNRVFVTDPQDMSAIVYTFEKEPSSQLKFVFEKYDLLPRPSTVGIAYITTPVAAFGFGPDRQNFQPDNHFGA